MAQDLEALVQTVIERPAALRLRQLLAEGLITASDRDLFFVSAQRYKEAAFTQYADFDPAVRDELVKALLSDYQRELDRLLGEITARRRTPPPLETPHRAGFLRRLFKR
ncbi:hypothetical protein [Amycolatopsis sp. NPDC051903]|uniref:hypothetical protein n=1 Tax=Amycolatopsis sp. NPDC051903 TaxID=3363936 RepID=UPI0037A2BF4C